MTIEDAYKITAKMTMADRKHMTFQQWEACGVIYREVLLKQYVSARASIISAHC
jgi:hypothetical protein